MVTKILLTDALLVFTIVFMVVVFMVASVYFLIRNERVCRFRCELIEMGYEVCSSYGKTPMESWDHGYQNKLDDTWHSITEIPYNKMLYSFKPLEIEKWLTKEQQEFLKLKF